MDIKDIKMNPNNPRIIKDDKYKKLLNSIKEFPKMLELRPIVIDKNNMILGWNMRYKACKELWIKDVPVKIAEDLTPEEEQRFIIEDNVWFWEWNMEMLANEWDTEDLIDWGVDIEIGLTTDEEKELIEDDIPEMDDVNIIVQKWDIFQLWDHILMCGDSMDEKNITQLLETRDENVITHCISDPPYWIAYNPDKHWMIKNDDKILDYTWLALKYTNWYFYMWTWYQVLDIWMKIIKDRFEKLDNVIIWHKGWWWMWDCARNLAQDFEIWLVVNRWNFLQWYRWSCTWYWNQEEKAKYIEKATKDELKQVLLEVATWTSIWKVWKDNTADYIHPTQKPVEINQRVIDNFTAKWDQVLDLFWGSGSNLITCEKTWRKMFMMELDEKYIQVILKRYYDYTNWEKEVKCLNRELDLIEILIPDEKEL
jgi:DNA modification methylase